MSSIISTPYMPLIPIRQKFSTSLRELTDLVALDPDLRKSNELAEFFSLCDLEGEELLKRLSADLKSASRDLSAYEGRYLVDLYYTVQKLRIITNNQLFQIREEGEQEPNKMLVYVFDNFYRLEQQIKASLQIFCESSVVGQWSLSQVGIGPVITAGLMAHTDITKSTSRSGYMRFAGLDPSSDWLGAEKSANLVKEVLGSKRDITTEDVFKCALAAKRNGKLVLEAMYALNKEDEEDKLKRSVLVDVLAKRPWNAKLRTLYCFKAGESFCKTQNRKEAFYGRMYAERKAYESAKNAAGDYAAQAAAQLEKKNYRKETEAYKAYSQGRLPLLHLHRRACRYAAKMFASHFWQVSYETHYGQKPSEPYPIAHLGHQDFCPPPNWPLTK